MSFNNKLISIVKEPVREQRISKGCLLLAEIFCKSEDLIDTDRIYNSSFTRSFTYKWVRVYQYKKWKCELVAKFNEIVEDKDQTPFFTNTRLKKCIYKLILEDDPFIRNEILTEHISQQKTGKTPKNIKINLVEKLNQKGVYEIGTTRNLATLDYECLTNIYDKVQNKRVSCC